MALTNLHSGTTDKLAGLWDCLSDGGRVLTDPAELRPYECDGLSAIRETPLGVVLPATELEVGRVLRYCQQRKLPVVARGAGTGLSGGARPHRDGIVLSLARLNRIHRIDPKAQIAVVGPGVTNLKISEAAAVHGLYYAPDPSSQIACTIGGNVAENSGGVHCLKYGLTIHNVLGITGFTAAGERITLNGARLESPGLDLLPLIVGSEGLLMVVTEVVVKLIPKPPQARVIMASFDDVERAAQAVAAIISAGIIPAGLEMMDQGAVQAVEPFSKAGYDTHAAAILLVESDGTAVEVTDELARLDALLRAHGARDLRVSESEAERLRLWSGRKNAFPAAGRISPDYYCMDGTIPRRHLGTILRDIRRMENEYGLRCLNVFHAGDGNLHPLILFDANRDGDWEKAEAFGAKILSRCVELDGTITGEHGVGIEKIDGMCEQFSSLELEHFAMLRRAIDPDELMNPGKLIPTLRRCVELGRTHVHSDSAKPFADLPRF